ncbi:beta-galactosidase, partial [Streptococcus suis]
EAKAFSDVSLHDKVSLFATPENVSGCVKGFYPKNLEELDQSTGYILYRTELERDKTDAERFRVVDARDRIQIYADGKFVAT